MQRTWNKLHPKERIGTTRRRYTRKVGRSTTSGPLAPTLGAAADIPTAVSESDTKALWGQLRKAMQKHYNCDTEFCAVEKMPGLEKDEKAAMKGYFRPEKPDAWDKKPTTWLDSFNIEDVMNQYEEAYPTYEFIGPVPIDFDAPDGAWGRCIVDELCKLDIREAALKGTEKIGIIYNLDPHDAPGSHWVCSFVDIPAKSAYYFDSYGYKPPKEIEVFLKRCRDQGCEHVYYNDVRHQRKGSECGMYCLFVTICLLKGRSFYDICTKIVDDDTMNSFRDVLFATETPRREAIEKALPRLCI